MYHEATWSTVTFVFSRKRNDRVAGMGIDVKRMPVLSAAIALAVLVACSESTTPPSAPAEDAGDAGGDGDAGFDAKRVEGCPAETPAVYPWQPPAAMQASACSEVNLTALERAIVQESLTASDIEAALGPSCAACAIGHVSDATWRAIVLGHDMYIGNAGGCVVHLGANEACGQAIDRVSTCLRSGCEGCTDRKAQDACADRLTTIDGPCAAGLTTARAQCPAATIASAFDTHGVCQSIVKTVRLFCGPRAVDGG